MRLREKLQMTDGFALELIRTGGDAGIVGIGCLFNIARITRVRFIVQARRLWALGQPRRV